MAITKIEVPELFDFGSDNSAFKLPTGTTAERPTSPSNGEMRFNTTTGYVEYYDTTDTQWWEIDYAPFVPSENFNAVLYTGTGSGSKSVTGVGFQPDLVWGKSRNDTISHILFDVVRGENKQLSSNTTGAEVTRASAAYEFDSDGFTVTTAGNLNNAVNYVAWNWKAGGTAVSNTDGTITSQVSANVDAGFSIVKYTGNGNTAQQSYGHGLSSAPELLITKSIDAVTQGTNYWVVGGTLLGNGGYMFLNTTSIKNTASSYNGNEVPDSEVIYTSGTSDLLGNQNNKNFITYCFHSVDGFSKIGSYSGGSTDTIVTGFRPAFLMVKKTNASGTGWYMFDNARNTSNPRDLTLFANSNVAEAVEGSYYQPSFLSNGFSFPVANGSGVNISGGEYIFMAFAADPT